MWKWKMKPGAEQFSLVLADVKLNGPFSFFINQNNIDSEIYKSCDGESQSAIFPFLRPQSQTSLWWFYSHLKHSFSKAYNLGCFQILEKNN